jgi:uncharacterized lipoprotein YajG
MAQQLDAVFPARFTCVVFFIKTSYLCGLTNSKKMKKLLLLTVPVLMLSACGSSGSGDAKSDTLVSPQMKEIHKSTNDVNQKSQNLNHKADSILKNL